MCKSGNCSISFGERAKSELINVGQMAKPIPIYRKMDFANPIVNKNEDDEFTTIRRGLKWSDLRVGEKILISDPLVGGNRVVGTVSRIGVVTGVKVKRFMDLDWKDLNYNFQEGCNSDEFTPKIFALTAINKAMEAVYPDFDHKEIVTWIKIKDSQEIE